MQSITTPPVGTVVQACAHTSMQSQTPHSDRYFLYFSYFLYSTLYYPVPFCAFARGVRLALEGPAGISKNPCLFPSWNRSPAHRFQENYAVGDRPEPGNGTGPLPRLCLTFSPLISSLPERGFMQSEQVCSRGWNRSHAKWNRSDPRRSFFAPEQT